jgi:hypothetical protein
VAVKVGERRKVKLGYDTWSHALGEEQHSEESEDLRGKK